MSDSAGRARLHAAAALLALTAALPSIAAADAITLRAVSPWPASDCWSAPIFEFRDRVNAEMAGRVQIDYLGHGDVIGPFDQFEALQNGVVDVILGVTSYYDGQIPEALSQLYVQMDPAALRASGYYDLMREIHRDKADVEFLAMLGGAAGQAFRLYVNQEMTSGDFSGKRMRVSGATRAVVEHFGGSAVVMPPGEIYTALERGTVDGFGWPYCGTVSYGWHEVMKHVIEHPFFSVNSNILMNGARWRNLPADIQADLERIAQDVEQWSVSYFAEVNAADNATLTEAGVTFLTFAEDEAARFTAGAYDAGWADVAARAGAETAERLRSLATPQ
jgi:TRAP-type C4-dicarboxylate transport system substrate-binding protein